MSGTCSPARWIHQLRLQQSSCLGAQGASLMGASQSWMHMRKQNINAGSTTCAKSRPRQSDSTIPSGRARHRTRYKRSPTISHTPSDSGAGTARLSRTPNERVVPLQNVLGMPSKKLATQTRPSVATWSPESKLDTSAPIIRTRNDPLTGSSDFAVFAVVMRKVTV
jgi:hypothetical protein